MAQTHTYSFIISSALSSFFFLLFILLLFDLSKPPIPSFFLYFFNFLWPELVHPSSLTYLMVRFRVMVGPRIFITFLCVKDSSCPSRNCLQPISIEESQCSQKGWFTQKSKCCHCYSCCLKTELYAVFCPYGTH